MKKSKRNFYLVIMLLIAVVIGIGYAALSATLNINGITTIEKASWDVHFENIKVTSGSITPTTAASIDTNKTTVNFGVTLTNPGDFYEFTVDEVNKGTIDAMISTFSQTGLSEEQEEYLDYTVTYSSGLEITEEQLLTSNQKETIKVRVAFKKDITASDLPTIDTTLDLTFSMTYMQADSTAIAIVHPVCRRATTLHTETCNTSNCIASGATVTYGNLGTAGRLKSGDAFDCDVNGDGTYDPTTERFYYVSSPDQASTSYATLIYYSNVSSGVADDNKTPYAYNSTDATEYEGPIVAKNQLPTTSQWSNVSLINVKRNIKDSGGSVRVTDFSYEGYAARLLTVQEVKKACGSAVYTSAGYLDGCEYLIENTKYTNDSLLEGYWLENTQLLINSYTASSVQGNDRSVNIIATGDTNYGVRPAIELKKDKILY